MSDAVEKPEVDAKAEETATPNDTTLQQVMAQLEALKSAQSGSDRKVKELQDALTQKEEELKQRMTEKEKMEYERQQRDNEFDEIKRELASQKLGQLRSQVAIDLDIPRELHPDKLSSYVNGTTYADMTEGAKNLMEYVNGVVAREVNKRLATDTAAPSSGNGAAPTRPDVEHMTFDDAKNLSEDEIQALIYGKLKQSQ
jgi:hypothetical protein